MTESFHVKAKFAFDLGLDLNVAFIKGATYEVFCSSDVRVHVRNGEKITSFNHADLDEHFDRIEGPFVPSYALEGLLEDFKPEHRHPAIDWGPAVGREFPNGYED